MRPAGASEGNLLKKVLPPKTFQNFFSTAPPPEGWVAICPPNHGAPRRGINGGIRRCRLMVSVVAVPRIKGYGLNVRVAVRRGANGDFDAAVGERCAEKTFASSIISI